LESEIWIKPVAIFPDPFRQGFGILALCEGYRKDRVTPAKGNYRWIARKVFEETQHEDPWFGIEQEFFLMQQENSTMKRPLGWPDRGVPVPQGIYYCSAGGEACFGRIVSETHLRVCLLAGLHIGGTNAEVGIGQWEFQCGICKGIEIGDHLWMARYLLQRVAELFNVEISFHPKPIRIPGWNGSGNHTNYSTNSTRGEGGMKAIEEQLKKLEEAHLDHIKIYGEDNDLRLSGKYETSSIHKFSYGVGDRSSSCRIPVLTAAEGKGYYEDRRPASNMDPYIVGAGLADTTILNGKYRAELLKAGAEIESLPPPGFH
jgi:glutamine synthetase